MTVSALKEENTSKITSVTPEVKGNLHQAILDYLHRNGFSKTLKRFQSEAQIQSDAGKDSLVHLEDVFCKYNVCNVDSNENTNKKPATKDQSEEVNDKKMSKNCTQISEEDVIVEELETKPKKKKKSKHDSEELKSDVLKKPEDDSSKKAKKKKKKNIQEGELEPSAANKNEVITEDEKQERKKKKKKSKSDSAIEDDKVEPLKKETKNENVQLDASRKDKKSSKKRKRSLSDENENGNLSIETKITEEPKGQKTVTSKETSNEETNGKVEINGGEKSTKRRRKDSSEPTTVTAFQRVKIDQVEFAHEKLQDNSYWAKDGADIGYGAKAQEVLGQVRGRDFRHEKTKKKRGSYRGGLIDLQSHSIKFNYSDED